MKKWPRKKVYRELLTLLLSSMLSVGHWYDLNYVHLTLFAVGGLAKAGVNSVLHLHIIKIIIKIIRSFELNNKKKNNNNNKQINQLKLILIPLSY